MQLIKQKGFTLVEIAIVLVIVGLLIGGVLKGQEMITNAKLKRIESDNAGIAAAMFSYQDRYLQLPGDDSDAVNRFTVYAPADNPNGNGDGVIGLGNDWDAPIAAPPWAVGADETLKFYAHLRAAGLVPGDPKDTTRPSNAYGGQIGVQDGSLAISGHVTIFGAIEGPIAKIIEGRLDDGTPDSGRIQSDVPPAPMDAGAVNTQAGLPYDDNVRYNMAFRL
ncbi:MAG: prepilin-type N-terminal cleavage/methylation domain-containing protein [Gammaproteobacteria bacterium]|nr:prepilin-type N-terminal cleavage/methylation domain-containing protein [Gammaproteobacteria bacterium]MDH3856897.1 prepilin-type N-terminal cleavage/methylation domain-containing protein [Gammaproteobacteria bacterium]